MVNNVVALEALDLTNKRVLIRQDLNVPLKDGEIASDARILASIPTIRLALSKGAKVMLMSHLGRPTEGEYHAQFSLQPVAKRLNELLNYPVRLVKNWLNGGMELSADEIVLCENVRFNRGEGENDAALARKMAGLCDIFVMDAFGTAHRAQASTYGVAQYAPIACAGPLLNAELTALARAFDNPKRPMIAIVGGAKVSSKLTVLSSLTQVVDQLIVGGGIANTFLAAQGHSVGKSLCEVDLIPTAAQLMKTCDIPLPSDVVTSTEISSAARAQTKAVSAVADNELIADIGIESAQRLARMLAGAGTIIWNGPVGVFEFEQFSNGTEIIARAIANSSAFSLAGGGDTLAAIDKYRIAEQISYISTGGGAFLEFLEGKTLPAVEILMKRARR